MPRLWDTHKLLAPGSWRASGLLQVHGEATADVAGPVQTSPRCQENRPPAPRPLLPSWESWGKGVLWAWGLHLTPVKGFIRGGGRELSAELCPGNGVPGARSQGRTSCGSAIRDDRDKLVIMVPVYHQSSPPSFLQHACTGVRVCVCVCVSLAPGWYSQDSWREAGEHGRGCGRSGGPRSRAPSWKPGSGTRPRVSVTGYPSDRRARAPSWEDTGLAPSEAQSWPGLLLGNRKSVFLAKRTQGRRGRPW